MNNNVNAYSKNLDNLRLFHLNCYSVNVTVFI